MFNTILMRIGANWKSGLTVALVSIPLSISLAIASGAAPVTGIITAVWAGLVAACFGGSNFNIVGPAGALSGILATYALIHGAASLPVLAIVAGGFILLGYFLRLERFLVFVPGSTLHGFTLGVAVIIALNQLNAALGLTGLESHKHFIENVWESLKHISNISWPTALVFIVFLAGLFILLKFLPKLPGAVVLAPIGILLGYLTTNNYLPFAIQTLSGKFGTIQATLIQIPAWHFDISLIAAGATVAFVGALETMLSAKIADGMTKTKYNERKEMLGLGLANIASGLAGGLAATGVLVRTSLNIKTGANHKTSSALNAIFVALISIVFIRYFSYIPMAVIAAILVFVSIRMVGAEHFIRFWKHDKPGFGIAMAVALVTVYTDPVYGLLLGITLALLLFVERLSRGQCDMIAHQTGKGIVHSVYSDKPDVIDHDHDVLVYSIKGQLAYINSQSHLSRFEYNLEKCSGVILRLRELYFIDIDGVDVLDEIIEAIQAKGKKVYLTGVSEYIVTALRQNSKNFTELETQGYVLPKTGDALAHFESKNDTAPSNDPIEVVV